MSRLIIVLRGIVWRYILLLRILCAALLAFLLCSTLLCATSFGWSEVTLETLIEKIEENERLYDDLDVTLNDSRRDFAAEADLAKVKPVQLPSEKRTIHCVTKAGLFRVESHAEITRADGSKLHENSLRMFDAEITRRLVTTKDKAATTKATLLQGRCDDPKIIRPHMILLRQTQMFVPLSIYLKGHEAMQAYPYGAPIPDAKLAIEYRGMQNYKTLRCHVVWVTHILPSSPKPYSRWALWLAEEKNYIPVYAENYAFRCSEETPIGDAEVTEWKELQPGVWFPMVATENFYDIKRLKEAPKPLIRQSQHTVEDLSLKPKVGIAYFRDLEIPDGVIVDEVKGYQITKTYRQNHPEQPVVNEREAR